MYACHRHKIRLCSLVYRSPSCLLQWLVCPREGCSLVLQTRFLFMNDVASTSADCSSSTVTTGVYPVRALSVLSRAEVARLLDASEEVGGRWRAEEHRYGRQPRCPLW